MNPVLRCSSLDRDLNCNGAITIVPLVNPRKGDEGDEGSALHRKAHVRMIEELGAVGDPGPEVEADLSFSQWIADYYFSVVKDGAPSGWSLEVEAGLSYQWPRFTLSGHIDSIALSPDATEAIGFDLKTGYDPVDPAECNEQVFGYACLLMRAYPDLRKVTFYIIQPRNDEDDGFQRVSPPMILEGRMITLAMSALEARINAAIDNRMELNTGRVQCKWCAAAIQCPALIAERELMKIALTPESLAKIKAEPDDATLGQWILSGRALARPLKDAEALSDERIDKNGYMDAADGTRITIKEEGGAYSYPDPMAYYNATRTIITSDEAYVETVRPSVTKTKEAIAKAMNIPLSGKKAPMTAEQVFDAHFRPLVVQGKRRKKVFNAPGA